MSSKLSAMRAELEECVFALEEASKDKYAPRSALESMRAEVTKRTAAISAAEDAGEDDEEDVVEDVDDLDDSEDAPMFKPAADEPEVDPDFDDDHEEILEDGEDIPDDAIDAEDGEKLPKDSNGIEINPLNMPARLRRELGEVNAEILDEYANTVQKKTRAFFFLLREHLDLGEVDAEDGNVDLIELLLSEVGKKGVSKIRLHFGEWREFVMKQLGKDMQAMFRAEDPKLAEEVAVRVPVVDREEVVDGVDAKRAKEPPTSLNSPVPDGLRRAKRLAEEEMEEEPAEEDTEDGDEAIVEEEAVEASATTAAPKAIAAAAPAFAPAVGRVRFTVPASDMYVGQKKTVRLT